MFSEYLPLDIPFDQQALYDSLIEFSHAQSEHKAHRSNASLLLLVYDHPCDDCMDDKQ
jgi:hypothetical protein